MVKPFDFFICDFQKKVNTFVYILLLAQLNTAFSWRIAEIFCGPALLAFDASFLTICISILDENFEICYNFADYIT